MLKIRRSRDRLILTTGIPIPGKDGFYIEAGPGADPVHLQNLKYVSAVPANCITPQCSKSSVC